MAVGCIPSSGDLPDSGILPMSLKSPALAGGFFTTGKYPGQQLVLRRDRLADSSESEQSVITGHRAS